MESPIDPRMWKYTFHTVAGLLAARLAWSLYRQRCSIFATLDAPFRALRKKGNSVDDTHTYLREILEKLQEDSRTKRGGARLSVYKHASTLLDQIKFVPEQSNAAVVEAALKIVHKVFASDAEGRSELYRLGGYRKVMSALGEAHKHGERALMETAASVLHALTAVDDSEVILPADVPKGAEGAYALALFPSTTKMLRTLDLNAPIVFLISVTGIFANVCTLHVGAQAIGKGTDGMTGASFFLKLLEHGHPAILEHAVVALRYLVRAGVSHDEISQEENVRKLAALLDAGRDPKLTHALLTIVLIMTNSPHSKAFFSHLLQTDALNALFIIWCCGVDKMLRERAELLVRVLDNVSECSPAIRKLMELHRSNILERRAKDEEAKAKQMQQMKQQQMMQQMMMQEMAGQGGGGGMDLAAMMGEE